MTPRRSNGSPAPPPEVSPERVRTADPVATTSGSAVLGGGAWQALSRMLPQAYVLLLSVAAARFLGPDGMGRQSFIAFVELSVVTLFAEGLAVSLTRYVGETLGRRQDHLLRGLVRWAWGVEAVGGLLGGGAMVAVALGGAEPMGAWVLAAVGASMAIMHTIPSAVLIGAQRWREAAIVGLVTGTIALPATVAVLAAGGGITGMFAVEALTSVANLVWTARLANRLLSGMPAPAAPNPDLRRGALRYALWTTIVVILAFIVFRRSEFFFLDHYSTDSEIALYSIAFAVVTGLALLPYAFADAILPAFAMLFGAGEHDRIRSGYSRSLRLLAVVALPVTAGAIALGPETLELAYGHDYAGTGPLLVVMAAAFPLLGLMSLSSSLLSGLGKVVAPAVIAGGAAAINLALSFLLIPPYEAVGAAIANTAAHAAYAIAMIVHCWRIVGRVMVDWPSLAGGVLASLAGGVTAAGALAALEGGVLGLAAGLLAGLAAFAAVAALMGVLAADDAEWLADIGAPRLGTWFERTCRLIARPVPGGTPR